MGYPRGATIVYLTDEAAHQLGRPGVGSGRPWIQASYFDALARELIMAEGQLDQCRTDRARLQAEVEPLRGLMVLAADLDAAYRAWLASPASAGAHAPVMARVHAISLHVDSIRDTARDTAREAPAEPIDETVRKAILTGKLAWYEQLAELAADLLNAWADLDDIVFVTGGSDSPERRAAKGRLDGIRIALQAHFRDTASEAPPEGGDG